MRPVLHLLPYQHPLGVFTLTAVDIGTLIYTGAAIVTIVAVGIVRHLHRR